MSTRESVDSENDEEYSEEDPGVSNRRYRSLKAEYERCRQQVHDLKRKLELNEAMLREVQEANETIERSFHREISEKKKTILEEREKHRVVTKEYESIVSDLETTLAERTTEIQELRQRVDRREESVYATTTDESANVSLETVNPSLQSVIDELETLLQEEKRKSELAEETIKRLQARCDEFQRISRNTKEQLDQKNRALEDVRAELEARTEAIALDMDPTRGSRKGNSLFAEVEDRRQNVIEKMNTLREKYMEAKRICKAQMTEIKTLKAERAMTFTGWNNYTERTLATNDELIQKYKHRISELENKLRSEIKRKDDTKQTYSVDASFGYLQSLLEAKKKETDELSTKIEDLSTRLLLQEETNFNIAKQLQYWRYKATALEAQVCALQGKLESDLTNGTKRDVYAKELEHLTLLVRDGEDDTTVNDRTKALSKQPAENFDRSLLSNAFSKTTRSITFLSPKTEELTAVRETRDKEESKDAEQFNISRNEPYERKHVTNVAHAGVESPTKSESCSLENLNTQDNEDNPRKSTGEKYKYPVLYIPVDSDNV